MSIPNCVRNDYEGYFLKEDVDIIAWINKVASDIPCAAFMYQLKAVFGSHINFENGIQEQIYTQIIPYLERDNEKRPCSSAGSEHAAYMQIHRHAPAPNKGKKPMTGSLQSRIAAHAQQPAKTGESSHQRLDAELDVYSQSHEPALPYDDALPSGAPDVEMNAPVMTGVRSTLRDESAMHLDNELDDIYD
ncbi:hypothetical protein M422DRAFT_247207 [Sphaerobolus stellatus SS14]|nr:hypothetical protein M422DRAFT_247207 [Sphaerobolus stellatus SS14]